MRNPFRIIIVKRPRFTVNHIADGIIVVFLLAILFLAYVISNHS